MSFLRNPWFFPVALIFLAPFVTAQNVSAPTKPGHSAPNGHQQFLNTYLPQAGDFGILCTLHKGEPRKSSEEIPVVRLDFDARFLIECKVERVLFGDTPWPAGGLVQFFIHSPARTFRGNGYESGLFDMIFHPARIANGKVIYQLLDIAAREKMVDDGDFTDYSIIEMRAPVAFVIVKSTPDYKEAHRIAALVARRLRIPLNFRDLTPDGMGSLTLPKKACEEDGGDYPCYYWRGRGDNGVYVSVEPTDAYMGFTPKLYIVVVASGAKDDADLMNAQRKAKSIYSDTYTKVVPIYMGCMH